MRTIESLSISGSEHTRAPVVANRGSAHGGERSSENADTAELHCRTMAGGPRDHLGAAVRRTRGRVPRVSRPGNTTDEVARALVVAVARGPATSAITAATIAAITPATSAKRLADAAVARTWRSTPRGQTRTRSGKRCQSPVVRGKKRCRVRSHQISSTLVHGSKCTPTWPGVQDRQAKIEHYEWGYPPLRTWTPLD